MLYGTLKQQNPAYKPKLWEKLDDLYVGGFQILERAGEYMPQQVNEPVPQYKERLRLASYINYLGMVVDSYTSNLFVQEPVVVQADGDDEKVEPVVEPFWKEFAADANLRGQSFSKVLRGAFTNATLKKRALLGCDFPRVAATAETRRDEDVSGAARAYAFEIAVEDLFDWEYSDIVTREVTLSGGKKLQFSFGLLSWAVLHREISTRPTPEAARGTFVEEFKVWQLGDDGKATWQIFRTEPRKRDDKPPSDDLDLKVAEDGATSFGQIPILELTVPDGLWLGNKLGPIALELFRRRSALNASENRHLFPVPVATLGPEIGAVGGALPPEVQQNPTRGEDAMDPVRRMGGLVLGSQDDFKFVEPEGRAYEIVDKQLSELVDEFFRVAHMMATSITNTSSALGRSGASKEQDYRAMAVVLEAYGAIVRDFSVRAYDLIAEARQEPATWKVHGLDKFDVIDRAIILDEAKTMGSVSIPSNTFRAHWQMKLALALLGNIDPATQARIEDEIERGVAAEEQMRDVMRDGMQQQDGQDQVTTRGRPPEKAIHGA